jgi:hypothetical protein
VNASFNTQVGNNDEFTVSLGSALPAATYYYAFRYSYNGCTYVYGGLNGQWNGTSSQSGVWTINPFHTVNLTSAVGTNAQSVCQGNTITNITYSIGTGGTGANVTGLPSGISANYSAGVLTISGTASAASNTYTYTITTTGTNSCVTVVTGTITVSPAPDFYNTQFPANATVCQGSNAQIYGQVFEGGVTNPAGQAPGLTAEIGYSTSNTNPNTWTNWLPATFFAQVGNNDEFIANLGSTLAADTYYYAFRYALNGCQYYYGGYSGSGGGPWNGSTNVNGVIVVDPTSVAGTVSANQTICQSTQPANITLSGNTGLIQWQVSTDNVNFTLRINANYTLVVGLPWDALNNGTACTITGQPCPGRGTATTLHRY